ncbi:tyrosine-type recombinase/integrase [Streptomyces sp. NPDC050704]|uniref:tyrosine-type recombinase/integrase n=1 Tax=Streptomyces sp. NPDC050704 TaxID=3157219 RepID=UPI003444A185
MAKEEIYDRWHKSRPKKGEPGCPEHPGLVPSADHGCEKRWQARWRDHDGRQLTKTFPKNKKTAAIAYQRSQRAAVEEGRDPLPNRRQRRSLQVPTIAEYVATFLEEHDVRSSTIEGYGFRLRGYVVPRLGTRPITEVRRSEYKKFFAALRADGMMNSYRHQVKKALSSMLSAALDDPNFGHLMPGNQVIGIKLSSERRQKARLTWEHVVALAEYIDPAFEILIWYGALQGLRSMEAAAVRKTDMKCRLEKMEVSEQRQRGKAVPLKTAHSYLVIPMGSFLVETYAAHMERRTAPLSARALRHRRTSGWTPRPEEYDQLVTVTRRGTPLARNTLSEAFNRAKERARANGVMVPATATFRDLRDFMDAVLIAAGIPPRSVQARMRHGTLAETLETYGFALEVDWENAPASFEELYGIPAPPGLPEAALAPRSRRKRHHADLTRDHRPGARRKRAPGPSVTGRKSRRKS